MTKSNTEDQHITITLKEYLEFQELKEHRKFVKITEITNFLNRDTQELSVFWESDGKVWSQLTGKLDRAGGRITELVQENDRLKLYKKAGFWKRVLIRMTDKKDDE